MVRLDGPGDSIPLTAPMAVVSGWLDDPVADGDPVADDPAADGHPVEARGAQPGEPGAGCDVGADRVSARHEAGHRPWAISPPQQMPGRGGQVVTLLEVRLLDDRLDDRLLRACKPGSRVRLGRAQLQMVAVPQCLEHASWEALAKGYGQRAWQIRTVSPATFRSRNRTSPWADPVTVARGLQSRWQALHAETAPVVVDGGARSVWVSDLDGHSEVVHLRGRVVSGYVGRLRYVADGRAVGHDYGADGDARAFDALMAFAAFAGIGSHTTYGFGAVVPEPTWQPPTTGRRYRS
jgi:hypothetical protein